MFNKAEVDKLIEAIWADGKGEVPTNQLVREAMRRAGLKGTNDAVALVVKSWKEDHGLIGSAKKAPSRDGLPGLSVTVPAATFTALLERTREAIASLAEVDKHLRVLEADYLHALERAEAARREQVQEFWNRVADAISEILAMHHSMTLHDVAEMFPEALCREAEGLGLKLDFGTLKERMSRWTPHDLHEVETDDRSYEG